MVTTQPTGGGGVQKNGETIFLNTPIPGQLNSYKNYMVTTQPTGDVVTIAIPRIAGDGLVKELVRYGQYLRNKVFVSYL